MIKRILLGFWMVTPVLLVVFHFGVGKHLAVRDRAADQAALARAAETREDWAAAVGFYDKALEMMPEREQGDRRLFRFSRARAVFHDGKLEAAIVDLEQIEKELEREMPDSRVLSGVRSELAQARFCKAWLLRQAGRSEGEWRPLATASKQGFDSLAVASKRLGKADEEAGHARHIVEVVRLENVSAADFNALPMPTNCVSCRL